MKIQITGHHVEITEAIESSVNAHLGKLVRHFPEIESMSIIITVEKNVQTAEGIVHFKGQDLVAKASNIDLYQSIAELRDKLESLLEKRKATIKAH